MVWLCVCAFSLDGDPAVAHCSGRSSASVSLSVFQKRPHVSPCAASLVARWREGERCAVCVPPASTWPLTTRPVKVMPPQKHPSAYHRNTPRLFGLCAFSRFSSGWYAISVHFIIQSDIMFMFGWGCYFVLTNHLRGMFLFTSCWGRVLHRSKNSCMYPKRPGNVLLRKLGPGPVQNR